MTIMETIEKLGNIGKDVRQKQQELTIFEVANLWHLLTSRYDAYETNSILTNFADAIDLKTILNKGHSTLQKQIVELEKLMENYGIVMPPKPPESTSNTNVVQAINDRYIYRQVLMGIQGFMQIHLTGFLESMSPGIRELFRRYLQEEMAMYDNLLEYGKMKGYVDNFPVFRP